MSSLSFPCSLISLLFQEGSKLPEQFSYESDIISRGCRSASSRVLLWDAGFSVFRIFKFIFLIRCLLFYTFFPLVFIFSRRRAVEEVY